MLNKSTGIKSLSCFDFIARLLIFYRILQDACNEARKVSKDSGLGKAKEKLVEGIRQAKSRLTEVESKL